jgi:N-acylneuraminate cytidylyltransferase
MGLIALLPMKGNSERIPGKNIKLLKGKPLFFYIADTLREAGLFDCLAINTDSEDISELAKRRYGNWVQIIPRPEKLVGDNVSMNLILGHDISLMGYAYDYFQTHSTNPLLSSESIVDAVNQYYENKEFDKFDSLFSVNKIKTRLYDLHLRPINHNPDNLGRTQDLDAIYEENSNFYIFSGEAFQKTRHRIGSKPQAYIMNRNSLEALDIDEQADWDFAEKILSIDNL